MALQDDQLVNNHSSHYAKAELDAHSHAPTQQEEAWDSSNEVLNNNVESPADHEAEAADNEAGEPSDEEICTCSAIEVDNTPPESDEI